MERRKFKNTKTAKVLGWTVLSLTTTVFLLYIGVWLWLMGSWWVVGVLRMAGFHEGL